MKIERDFLIWVVMGIVGFAIFISGTEVPKSGSVQMIGILPNQTITPGATNPDITQENISQTICNKNWSTASIRPTSAYTTALKKKQITQYGYSDTKTGDFEEDHLISLELGGNPTDPKNLWPEPYVVEDAVGNLAGAKQKDTVENYLHGSVCAGGMTLQKAQQIITTGWYSEYQAISRSHSFGATETLPSDSDLDDDP